MNKTERVHLNKLQISTYQHFIKCLEEVKLILKKFDKNMMDACFCLEISGVKYVRQHGIDMFVSDSRIVVEDRWKVRILNLYPYEYKIEIPVSKKYGIIHANKIEQDIESQIQCMNKRINEFIDANLHYDDMINDYVHITELIEKYNKSYSEINRCDLELRYDTSQLKQIKEN